ALVQFPNPAFAFGLGALVVANRIIWIDFVEIKYSGKSLNVDPVLLLLSIAYWGWFWGILGLILAVPMTVCLKIALSNLEKGKPWAILLSEE
ncbi:MAG: AI-2E family transporter, partial [Phycisphaerae bacterium]